MFAALASMIVVSAFGSNFRKTMSAWEHAATDDLYGSHGLQFGKKPANGALVRVQKKFLEQGGPQHQALEHLQIQNIEPTKHGGPAACHSADDYLLR
jgi:hypothetical protein